MRRFFARLSNFLHRERADREMAREIDSHLALIEDDLIRRGMTPLEARLAARRSYGGVEQTKERHRDARSFVWLEQLLQDARHAYRSLAKSPGFVAVAMLSLAFGIGVNTAIFTLVSGILLKELPVADPHRIVQINTGSFPEFRELRRQDAIFSDAVAFSSLPGVLEINGDPQKIDFEMVTGSYFAFFGARPALGRLLDEEDDRVEGAHPVCVLSHAAWSTHFGSDPRVLGRTIRIDGVPLQVVGVAGPGFVGGELQRRYDVWVPTALVIDFNQNRRDSSHMFWLSVLARLKPGISFAEANSRLKIASPSIGAVTENRADADKPYTMQDASKGFDTWRSGLHDPLAILMGAVFLVLLLACANLANLLLARANERQREFAIKLSLGISRWRLLRELLLETLALAFGGGAVAILLAGALTRFLLDLYNAGSRYQTLSVSPDALALGFTLGVCCLTALVAGLYPAWQASRADAAAGLKGAPPQGLRGSYARRVLILVQIALAVVLLYGASLFTHSLRNLKTIDLGFDIRHVLSVDIAARGPGKSVKPGPPLAQAEVLQRVRQLSAVESAAFSFPGALSGGMMMGQFRVLDGSRDGRDAGFAHIIWAGPGYFSTLRMPILRGRDFGAADHAGAPLVAIVNQRLAATAWPGQDPVGKSFRDWNGEQAEVVGVVGDSKYQRIREEAPPVAYRAFDQMGGTGFDQMEPVGALEVRCRGSVGPVERDIRRIVKTTAPDYQVSDATSMEIMRDGQISQERLLAFLSNLFGALGAVLALVGIYGLISYSVTRRTREVGVRMSVGAQSGDVLWLFARESLALTAIGMLLGLPLALLLARFAKKMLFEVRTSDPLAVGATLALIALGALLAAYFPGHRATRIDPVRALRWD
jgi:predicted permease